MGRLMIWLLALALLYVVLVAVAFVSQDRMLYFPDAGGTIRPERLGLEPWPSAGPTLGFVSSIRHTNPRGTFLVWHGNAGSAVDRVYYTAALGRRGYRVLLLEYPAYGTREGKLGESSFVTDGRAAAERALDAFGQPLYLMGESMGCGVATAVAAALGDRAAGVVLVTPWNNLPDLAQARYPLLPAKWLTRDRYDNARNLRGYEGPVAMAMCERDEIIPAAHTRRLFESIRSPKHLWIFEESGHNSWPTGPDETWWDEMLEFLATASAPPSPSP